MSSLSFPEAIQRLEAQSTCDAALAQQAFAAIFAGAWNPTQVAAFLIALKVKGESAEVIAQAAAEMIKVMIPLEHSEEILLDTCGTGGNGAHHLNLSTGAAIIAAAGGIKVAKHGNRAATSLCGSADVLEELGIHLDLTPEQQAKVLSDVGLVFLFARNHHPQMKHVGPARKELQVRTLFNCLGPLASPARVTHQLLGAYSHELRPILAGALIELGVKRAWVLRSEDGMDELSPLCATKITQVDGGVLSELSLAPEDFGLTRDGSAAGGDKQENAAALLSVLRGEQHPGRTAFLLNAAATFCVVQSLSPREAGEKASTLVDSGAALAKLKQWSEATQHFQ